jgi:hypothetical protein
MPALCGEVIPSAYRPQTSWLPPNSTLSRVGTVDPVGMACPPLRTVLTPLSVYGSPSLKNVLEAVLFNRAAFACPTFPAWNPRTVSLPLSDSLSSVLPRLIRWLIQLLLAAKPITGKRWVLWRLRCHTGVHTQAKHQLRQSCLSA